MEQALEVIKKFWNCEMEQSNDTVLEILHVFESLYRKYRIIPSSLPKLLRRKPKDAEELLYLLLEFEDGLSSIYKY
ncbi:Uncharacterised protein [Lysinibacillus capsici]|uniref:Uncharacterized protein n=1 Tax=Lysinibacillus capsici TaxID=2115968 RepID=A0A2X1AB23_9BACI|nr:hypothetical protein [Lysinibacillus capsici]SPU40730.1 Uncharacterised protein [Lysinibacillus capsici]